MDLTCLWLLATSLMVIQQYQASASSVTSPAVGGGPLAHRRERRCSCENQKDKECIFFCHIGIVWVNTPSHVVPYGFGAVRFRRELSRCSCSNTQDATCLSFCSVQPQTLGDEAVVTSYKQPKRNRAAFWEKRSRHALKPQT
ncbi:hypothetical protein Q5P01_004568 [Channa striata]|uniref:Endothelin-like toxin domain-containing protein n=1 Tax=Channa striata TaxID=64152 RepID=A0AA88SXP7_CHASR|nr:hypothetical protein Q5P01_004568 [Channa striata]